MSRRLSRLQRALLAAVALMPDETATTYTQMVGAKRQSVNRSLLNLRDNGYIARQHFAYTLTPRGAFVLRPERAMSNHDEFLSHINPLNPNAYPVPISPYPTPAVGPQTGCAHLYAYAYTRSGIGYDDDVFFCQRCLDVQLRPSLRP